MNKYIKHSNKPTPSSCQKVTVDGQTFVISDEPLNLALLFLFDLEPVDKSNLSENDRSILEEWYEDKEINRWWREPTYEEKILDKSPTEIERDLYGKWEG